MRTKGVLKYSIHNYGLLLLAFASAFLAVVCGGEPASPQPGGEGETEAATGVSSAGSFAGTGEMIQPRQVHTATELADGRVLVTGGRSRIERAEIKFSTIYSSAETYDPSTGTWSLAGSMSEERTSHTATLLRDGRVLVAGDRGTKSSPDIFDPAIGTWSVAGDMVDPRGEHTATLLQDGRVLLAGGLNFYLLYLTSAEVYDPATDTWSETGRMAEERSNHTATLLPDGRVLVAGSDVSLKFLPTAELYDPASGAWSAASSMAESRAFHSATLLKDGRVLVVGAHGKTSAETYEPATDTWSPAGNAAETRASHTATLLMDGRVLVAGGSLDVFAAWADARSSAELYDPVTNTWSPAASMSYGRYRFTATMLKDGGVLVAGGQDADEVTGSAELYSP